MNTQGMGTSNSTAQWSAPKFNKKAVMGGGYVQKVTGFSQNPINVGVEGYENALREQQQYNQVAQKYGASYDGTSTQFNSRTGTNSSSSTANDYGGDWTDGNSMFSFDNMRTMAKEMASDQLAHSEKMMGLSHGYRSKEKVQDNEIRMRESDQKFGFDKALQHLQNTHQKDMQTSSQTQERTMFGLQDNSATAKINSARGAANRLYFGGGRRGMKVN